jgi:RNA polymerase sigma factor (sigma-70 family)
VTLTRADIDRLYRDHGKVAFRRARGILGDDEAAADVAHEVFADLVARPEQFHGRSAFTTFLYAAVTHRCLQRLRDEKNRARLLAQNATGDSSGGAGGDVEKLVLLRQLTAQLPAELGAVAFYFYVDAMTYDQIAEVMDCSRRHVSDLLTRFRDAAAALVKRSAS